jgi:hypothetical protein
MGIMPSYSSFYSEFFTSPASLRKTRPKVLYKYTDRRYKKKLLRPADISQNPAVPMP